MRQVLGRDTGALILDRQRNRIRPSRGEADDAAARRVAHRVCGQVLQRLLDPVAIAGDGSGVEMAKLPDGQIAVRNSAHPDGPALIYTRAEIEALIGGAQDGDFDALLA